MTQVPEDNLMIILAYCRLGSGAAMLSASMQKANPDRPAGRIAGLLNKVLGRQRCVPWKQRF